MNTSKAMNPCAIANRPGRPNVPLVGMAMLRERVGRDTLGVVGDFTFSMTYNCAIVLVGLADACN